MRRAVAALTCTAALLVFVAPSASADPPFQVRISDPFTTVLPGGDFCGFDVQADVEQKFKIITFSGDRGTLWTAHDRRQDQGGPDEPRDRGDARPEHPRPGFPRRHGNPITGTGPWLVFVPGQLLFLVGHITFEPGPFGVQPSVVRGRSLDLCEALA